MQYFVSFFGKMIALFLLFLMSCGCYCSLPLPHEAVGWSALCDYGICIYWSFTLSVFLTLTIPYNIIYKNSKLCLTLTLFTARSKAMLLCGSFLLYMCICFVFVMPSCLFTVALWLPIGKRATLLGLLCAMFYCGFCYFPVWCPGSGVLLICIDS